MKTVIVIFGKLSPQIGGREYYTALLKSNGQEVEPDTLGLCSDLGEAEQAAQKRRLFILKKGDVEEVLIKEQALKVTNR